MANSASLPDDILQLICTELQHQKDFGTLFNLSVVSKTLAPLALTQLYRMHDSSVNDEETDGINSAAQQELLVQKWSIMWRSIILSGVSNKTMLPYCKFLRLLNLRDLRQLLEDNRFRGKIEKHFFSGPLKQFHFQNTYQFRVKGNLVDRIRLELDRVVKSVGDALIPHCDLVDELWVDREFSSEAALTWAPHLSRLQRLDLYDGQVLSDHTVRQVIYDSCPKFNSLSMFQWITTDYDHQLASFIQGLPTQKLQSLRTVSRRGVGLDSCTALNAHGSSLVELKTNFEEDAIPALALLDQCSSLQVLHLELSATDNLETENKEVQGKLINWLGSCKDLQEISLTGFKSAPSILTPLLLSKDVRLEGLLLGGSTAGDRARLYPMRENRDFHFALANQTSLQDLCLAGDPDGCFADDNEALVESLGQLSELRKLQLFGVSEYLQDKHIIQLFGSLSKLEDVYISGYGISDAVLLPSASLPNLKAITFAGSSNFTAQGLRDFIGALKPSNEGISLSIEMADPDTLIDDDTINAIRGELWSSRAGKIDYTPLRDPDMSEFEGESD